MSQFFEMLQKVSELVMANQEVLVGLNQFFKMLQKVSELVMAHQEVLVGFALLITVLNRYSWLISRTLLTAGGAVTAALAPPDPSLRLIYVWAYVACVFILASVFRRNNAKLSREAEAYIAMHRAKLIKFYKEHAPEKINEVDQVLAKYRGHESVMWQRLERKYLRQDLLDEDDFKPSPVPQKTVPKKSTSSRTPIPSRSTTPQRSAPRTPPPTPASPALRAPPPTPNSPSVVEQAREEARLAMQRRVEQRLRRK
uniref:Uncharacterized protein n=1 Tax=Aureoumbra lagunensis TaxID=44058 RepID=A0A7S3JSM5_9STRA|mmetsp:Transcript_10553/g.14577  ORF Transcript_10553/g.14577 Transcript_10553/m.14577 type:complete len:255 (+) Transcript_10553:16-780(+)